MPVKIPSSLPAKKLLERENIFVMTEARAKKQEIRPLRIAILNLMPTKEVTETQLLRLIGNSPLQVDAVLLRTATYKGKNTSDEHLAEFYRTFEDVKRGNEKFDGLIITGAPVENMPFEDVDYWDELCGIMEWSKKNVYSTMHICWGAQAGLYRRYGITKHPLEKKLFGIFPHGVNEQRHCLFRGFDDEFLAPQSRHTASDRDAIIKESRLTIQSETPQAGVFIVTAREGREIYISGHLEYDALTLDREYRRDINKGLNIEMPKNYYPDDEPSKTPVVRWRAHANLFFDNWINYVYQETPYNLDDL